MHTILFQQMVTFYDCKIFTQRQISTILAEMSDQSLLWKLRKTLMFSLGFNASVNRHLRVSSIVCIEFLRFISENPSGSDIAFAFAFAWSK